MEPKFDKNKNLEQVVKDPGTQSSGAQEVHNFAIEKLKVRNGFVYQMFFETEEEAASAVKAFWNMRQDSKMATRGLQSGMLKPFKHEITCGDRTSPRNFLLDDESKKYPDKSFAVNFNGNTEALSPKGEAALRQMGFIE